MDFAKCWSCEPPPPAWALVILLLAMIGLVVATWKAMRPRQPPDWWHAKRRGTRG